MKSSVAFKGEPTCRLADEKHATVRGRKVHEAFVGGVLTSWFGRKKFTGYFDETPNVLEEFA